MSGGPQLVNECLDHVRQNGELVPGTVFVSSAGSLPCQSVIHTVGPMWKNGSRNEDMELKRAVEAAVEEADRKRYRSVSLPAVSCGVYGFPVTRGSQVILSALRQLLDSSRSVIEVSIVSGQNIIPIFHETLTGMFGASNVRHVDTAPRPDYGKSLQLERINL